MELITRNKAAACFHIANELCKDVRSIDGTMNPKPWHTDGKVKAQSKLIRKVFDILYGDIEVTTEESEPDVACLKIAYDLSDNVTTLGTMLMSPANTDEGAIARAGLIRDIFDILHDRPSDLPLFEST